MSDFDVNELKRCIRDTSNTDRFIESVQVNYDNVVRVTNRIYERSAKGSISCIVYLEDIIIANTDLFDTLDYNGKLSSIEYILNLLEEELGKESERRLIAEEYAQSNNLSIVSNELLKDLRNDGQKAARYETAIFLAILLLLLCAVVIVGLLT